MEESPEDRYKRIHAVRKKAKVVTYSAMYGVGKAKLARSSGMTEKEAGALLQAFWEMNWAVKEVAGRSKKKVLKDGSLWIQNPVSGFWHSLRDTKDSWSTINQSTGVYVFDNWLAYILKENVPVIMQYHDEYLGYIPKGGEVEMDRINKEAIEKLNNRLQLNVPIGSDWKYGDNYAAVH